MLSERKFVIPIADIEKNAWKVLSDSLSDGLYYHNIKHTFVDVYEAAMRIAESMQISTTDLLLLKIAVIYHDFGYLEQFSANEAIGARIAGEELEKRGMPAEQIRIVQDTILATRVSSPDGNPRQTPEDVLLQKIICDADLDNLGRDDFFHQSQMLQQEFDAFDISYDAENWWPNQLRFLEQHHYFTENAIQVRQPGKERNILKIKELMAGKISLGDVLAQH